MIFSALWYRWVSGSEKAICRLFLALSIALCLVVGHAGCISILGHANDSDEDTTQLLGGALDFVVPAVVGALLGGGGGALVGLVAGVPIYFIDKDLAKDGELVD